MNPGMDNVLSTRDEKVHDELRKRMAAGYSGKENVTLERDIDDCITELIHLIENRYVTTDGKVKFMDLAQKIQFFTADVMSKLSFDAKFHDLRDDNDNLDYIQEVYTNFPVMFCFSVIPKFVDFMTNTGILSLMAPTANSKMGFGRILGIAQNQVGSRFNQEGKAEDLKDMMGSFLRHGLTQQDCERESVLQMCVVPASPELDACMLSHRQCCRNGYISHRHSGDYARHYDKPSSLRKDHGRARCCGGERKNPIRSRPSGLGCPVEGIAVRTSLHQRGMYGEAQHGVRVGSC